jgi:hypothetical protein
MPSDTIVGSAILGLSLLGTGLLLSRGGKEAAVVLGKEFKEGAVRVGENYRPEVHRALTIAETVADSAVMAPFLWGKHRCVGSCFESPGNAQLNLTFKCIQSRWRRVSA